MTIRPVEAELFHADGRTDITKQIVAFRNFANTPQISDYFSIRITFDCFYNRDSMCLLRGTN
jgi:hypothetical protein